MKKRVLTNHKMCKLNFDYQAKNVPDQMKKEFEDRVNKKYALGCEGLNKSDTIIIVNWVGNPQKLRGLFFLTKEVAQTLALDIKNEIF